MQQAQCFLGETYLALPQGLCHLPGKALSPQPGHGVPYSALTPTVTGFVGGERMLYKILIFML